MILLIRLRKKMKPKKMLRLKHSQNWLLKNSIKIWRQFKESKKYPRNLIQNTNLNLLQLRLKMQPINPRPRLKHKSSHRQSNQLKKSNQKNPLNHQMTVQLKTLLAHHLTPSLYSNKNNIIMQLKNKIIVFDFKVTP